MKIEEQVLSIEQAKHLQALGLDMSDAAHCWYSNQFADDLYIRLNSENLKFKKIPTYTLQETLQVLPKEICIDGMRFYLVIDYNDGYVSYKSTYDDDYCEETDDVEEELKIYDGDRGILDSSYNLLCWVIEEGFLK